MGLVCHDAGAANILIAAFKRKCLSSVMVLMEGPAKYIWKNAFPEIPCDFPLNEMVNKASCIFTGSGWASSLEFDAINRARDNGLFCTTVLDHWVNYEERFNRRGLKAWPDRFLVTDPEAYKLACLSFPSEKVVQCKSFYLEDQINKISSMEEINNKQFLYICEPMRHKWGREQDGEFQVLEYFLETLGKLKIPYSYKILLRPHPSESFDKYHGTISESKIPVEVSRKVDIAEDIGESSVVFGCNSYGLVISVAADKPTYNVIPPWAPPSILPHMGIRPLSELSFK